VKQIVAAALGAVLFVGACGSAAEPDLLSMLPSQVDGFALQPQAMPFAVLQSFTATAPEGKEATFIAATGANEGNFEGYLLAVNLGTGVGAYRVRGASKAALEEGCAALLYSELDKLTRRDVDGRSVLLLVDDMSGVEEIWAGCYVRHDVAFWAYVRGDLVVDYFKALPVE
jgi:hypothetical protein